MSSLTINLNNKTQFNQWMFFGGEPHVRLTPETVEAVKRADDINIIARISNPTETMNLLLLRDAIYGVNPLTEVRAILPYLPHGRAERRFCEGDCEGLNVFLNLLEGKFSKIVTLDAHKESPRYISVAVDGLIQESILSCAKASLSRNVTVILPNETSDSRYIIPSHVGTNTWEVKVTTVNCSKKREPETGKILGFSIPLWDIDPANPVLVVDDICDGGRTFVGLAEKIHPYLSNEKLLYLYVSLGIFSAGYTDLQKYFRKIFTTNAREQSGPSGFLHLYDSIPLLLKEANMKVLTA